MGYNGSGVFVRLYNWTQDKANGIKIRADRMDAEMDGMATGLSTAVTKDGQTQPTANLPMAGFRHTGVGNGSARTDYAAVGQVQDASFIWAGTATGTADVITITTSPITTAYAAGQRFQFIASGANTTNVTLNVNTLGAKAVTKDGATALTAGDIPSGGIIDVQYDGTRFQLININDLSASGGTITGTITMSGAAINFAAEVSVASATTTDIGAAASNNVLITGTTTITGFGTVAAGVVRYGRFSGALTLTHNGTSLILPGGANITTAANDQFIAESLGSGNWIVKYFPQSGLPIVNVALRSHIAGLSTSSITGNSTTAAVTITAGQATDSTNVSMFTAAGFSWAVSNGNAVNGYQGGTTLPNSSTIHFYVIATATDTTWSASFASTSLTPTLPGSYTKYRRIFSLVTTAAGALRGMIFIESSGGGMQQVFVGTVLDVTTTALGTSATLYTLSTPSGVKTTPYVRAACNTDGRVVIITSPDEQDEAPIDTSAAAPDGFTTAPGTDIIVNANRNRSVYTPAPLFTNTSSQIRARASGASTAFYVVTRGWEDFRR